ncbi:hypothetical protein QBC45DRAFT_427219 [Copromyces sp. CBS 386.78]|nr:hypothetical protein QBC45DRAFT_427219 [Copromyces sp. CBS 386.78]
MGVEDWIPTYHPRHPSGAPGPVDKSDAKETQNSTPTSNPSSGSGIGNNNFCDKHGFLPTSTSDGGSSGVQTVTVEHTTSSAELQKEGEAKVKEEGK